MYSTWRMRPARGLWTWKNIKLMIHILHVDTVPNVERWEGHTCIPNRVFEPQECLIDPPKQPTKPRITSRPYVTSGGSKLANQQPPSQLGNFKATRTQCGECDSRHKEQGDSASAQFIAWFDTTFASLIPS